MKKAVFFLWGFVYWPFLIVGTLFFGLATVFYGIGDWFESLLIGWAYPVEEGCSACCSERACECGAVR